MRCSYVGCIDGLILLLDCSLYHYVVPFFVSHYSLILKSILSDICIATPAFIFISVFMNYLFHPFTFSLCVSFLLRWVSCRQHIYGSCFLIHSATLSRLIVAFNSFTFKVIIDRYAVITSLLCIFIVFSFFFLKKSRYHFL